ncbi:hypothetical protein DEJ49_02995 [Streptomyces venezuelae]|uniref:Uncharacterized protein n=1 Tax=Streptomyces venezuelae TaxID=54571 RepID=A0A5P2CCU0_STRVZ|nr:hypothetical protein [Streptomyces venezuelae]QES40080.1 hypothetical protein DEJ49_02995 [Streptomyces venezuelae]
MRQSPRTRATRHAIRRVAPPAALVFLIATLFMCLGPVAPDGGHKGTGHAGAVAVTRALSSGSLDHHAVAVEGSDCPDGDHCCAPAAHGVRATPAPTGPSLSDLHRQEPCSRAPSAPGPAPEQPSNRGSPDLHMLQVQRT